MQFIHAREFIDGHQCVRVDCDTQCNVQLTDDMNFSYYKGGQSYRYTGGFYKRFPVVLTPPFAGYWNVTLDLGDASANIRYSIAVISL